MLAAATVLWGVAAADDNAPAEVGGGPAVARPRLNLSVPLDDLTVTGRRDPLSQSDARLKQLTGALPCIGCDGRRNDQPPLALTIATNIALAAARSFFIQPHVRHEANDEALYYAHQEQCTPDNQFGCLSPPHSLDKH